METNETRCIFERKNDILSRIEDMLIWTKSEQNTWYGDPGLTMMASATLLKMGYDEKNLNLNLIENQIKAGLRKKDYLLTVEAFSNLSAGLLALFLAKRKSQRTLLRFVKKNVSMLKDRNWMNSTKTTVFLILPLKEAVAQELIPKRRGVTDEIEEYLISTMEDPKVSYENLAYALFSLSFINPSKVKNFLEKTPELKDSLVQHRNIEIKAVSLQAFDRAGIPCAESVYQTMWNYFEELQYGKTERTILSKITSGIYNVVTGVGGKIQGFSMETSDEETKLSLTMPTESLKEMIKSIPPLDQLCLVALCILYSTYRTLFLFTQPKVKEYQRLQNLETKFTHTPVKNEDLTKISGEIYRYQKYGITSLYVILPLFLLTASIIFSWFITPFVQQLQSPFREVIVALPPFLFGGFSLHSILITVREKLAKAKERAEKLRSEGKW